MSGSGSSFKTVTRLIGEGVGMAAGPRHGDEVPNKCWRTRTAGPHRVGTLLSLEAVPVVRQVIS